MSVSEKRKRTRLPFEADVVLTLSGGRQFGRSVNISHGGTLIKTDPAPKFGARLTLHISLPGLPDTCKIPCVVRWTNNRETSTGLQFEHLRAIEVWGLNKLINELKQD
ncbi:MAG: PilZ domain-containing protein [Proteobacteria bacterium]|nr:PilZ domain-containing protein [Pseudomonadota bacterium]